MLFLPRLRAVRVTTDEGVSRRRAHGLKARVLSLPLVYPPDAHGLRARVGA